MKILCLSDLHRQPGFGKGQQNKSLQKIVKKTEPDVVVISGDVHENIAEYPINAFKDLSKAFKDITVLFTLGNHEFFYTTPTEVHERYKAKYRPEKYDVHCLDLLDYYDIDNVRFLGNVLWYDGSMATQPMQNLDNWADGSWADRLIKNFDYYEECRACQKRIETTLEEAPGYMTKVLVTHCVPHEELNGHMFKTDSPYNAFSGVKGYLEKLTESGLEVDYSLCGHTHWRIVGKEIADIQCINVGSDYWKLDYYLLEV